MATGFINVDGNANTIKDIDSTVKKIDNNIISGMNDINDKVVSMSTDISKKLDIVSAISAKSNTFVKLDGLQLAGVGPVDIGGGFTISNGPCETSSNQSAVVYHGKIHVFENDTSYNDYRRGHYVWDGISWNASEEVPIPCKSNAVVFNDRIHVFGKYDDSENSSTVRHYSWDDVNGWRIESWLPVMARATILVTYNGYIHMCGAFVNGQGRLSLHYRYDGYSWTQLPNMPWYTEYHTICVCNNKIHAVNSLEHYAWDGNSWSKLSDLPSYTRTFSDGYAGIGTLFNYNDTLYYVRLGDPDESYGGGVCYAWSDWNWVNQKRLPSDITTNIFFIEYTNELHAIYNNSPLYHYVFNTKAYKLFLESNSMIRCELGSRLYSSDKRTIVSWKDVNNETQITIPNTGVYYLVTNSPFYINA